MNKLLRKTSTCLEKDVQKCEGEKQKERREEERLTLKSQVQTDRKRLKEPTLPASSPNLVRLCCTAHWGFSHTNALFPQPNSSCTLATHKNLTLQRKNEKSSFYHLRRS